MTSAGNTEAVGTATQRWRPSLGQSVLLASALLTAQLLTFVTGLADGSGWLAGVILTLALGAAAFPMAMLIRIRPVYALTLLPLLAMLPVAAGVALAIAALLFPAKVGWFEAEPFKDKLRHGAEDALGIALFLLPFLTVVLFFVVANQFEPYADIAAPAWVTTLFALGCIGVAAWRTVIALADEDHHRRYGDLGEVDTSVEPVLTDMTAGAEQRIDAATAERFARRIVRLGPEAGDLALERLASAPGAATFAEIRAVLHLLRYWGLGQHFDKLVLNQLVRSVLARRNPDLACDLADTLGRFEDPKSGLSDLSRLTPSLGAIQSFLDDMVDADPQVADCLHALAAKIDADALHQRIVLAFWSDESLTRRQSDLIITDQHWLRSACEAYLAELDQRDDVTRQEMMFRNKLVNVLKGKTIQGPKLMDTGFRERYGTALPEGAEARAATIREAAAGETSPRVRHVLDASAEVLERDEPSRRPDHRENGLLEAFVRRI